MRPFANLEAWCHFWTDEGERTPCCLTASQDLMETEPEMFDCSVCAVRVAQDALWPENADAWQTYVTMRARFVRLAAIGPVVFDRLTAGMDPDDVRDLLDRLSIIAGYLEPPQAEGTTDGA